MIFKRPSSVLSNSRVSSNRTGSICDRKEHATSLTALIINTRFSKTSHSFTLCCARDMHCLIPASACVTSPIKHFRAATWTGNRVRGSYLPCRNVCGWLQFIWPVTQGWVHHVGELLLKFEAKQIFLSVRLLLKDGRLIFRLIFKK
jgi:hypothetical protein